MWKARFELSDRRRSIPSESSPKPFLRPSATSSQPNLEILAEEEEEISSSPSIEDERRQIISLTIHRPNSSHSFSKHQSALPTIPESQDSETTNNNNHSNTDERPTNRTDSAEKLRQFTIERRIYELLQQQRDVRQEKVRQYFCNFASTHCQTRKRIVS